MEHNLVSDDEESLIPREVRVVWKREYDSKKLVESHICFRGGT
jgi:hypothetical protein